MQVTTTNPNDKGTSNTLLYTLFELHNLDITGHTLSIGITLTTNPSFNRKVEALIDTGSLRQDFVSPFIAQCLAEGGAKLIKLQGLQRCRVCTLNECTLVDTLVSFNIIFLNEITKLNEQITIKAWVLPSLQYDIIIGRPTIEREQLLSARKISLSGDAYSYTYKLPSPVAGVTPLCTACIPKKARKRKRVIYLKLPMLRLSYNDNTPLPVFYDSASFHIPG